MKYAQPLGEAENASYVDGNPEHGIMGSVVPAAAIEPPMRELVNVIEQAGLTPDANDLTQLRQAIVKIIGLKAPLATTQRPGLVQVGSGLSVTAAGLLSALTATAARAGIVELATTVEAAAGTDNARAVTPAGLAAWGAGLSGVPKGGIISFSGTFGGTGERFPIPLGGTTPDTRWCLCDGVTTNGFAVPDLRDRMIMGAGTTYKSGSKGGSATHTHSLSGTVGATTLTVAQLAGHGHTIVLRNSAWGNGNLVDARSGNRNDEYKGALPSSSVGGSQPHTHDLSGSSEAASSLPPYYAMAFIMRIA